MTETSQSKPDGFASSPEGGALGKEARFEQDEEDFLRR